ncbi:hypothetical protein AB205_0161620 [Aquarana catesbeiana]|uniref:Uncharacterized protein n=1 Tax=Aquarana catesbeiana TaxID=8400 RepID=A0A2G9RIJ5_AQUCT|nr:hypothetical protein AB205_0161620 [Aquarana catesbeiana]
MLIPNKFIFYTTAYQILHFETPNVNVFLQISVCFQIFIQNPKSFVTQQNDNTQYGYPPKKMDFETTLRSMPTFLF